MESEHCQTSKSRHLFSQNASLLMFDSFLNTSLMNKKMNKRYSAGSATDKAVFFVRKCFFSLYWQKRIGSIQGYSHVFKQREKLFWEIFKICRKTSTVRICFCKVLGLVYATLLKQDLSKIFFLKIYLKCSE